MFLRQLVAGREALARTNAQEPTAYRGFLLVEEIVGFDVAHAPSGDRAVEEVIAFLAAEGRFERTHRPFAFRAFVSERRRRRQRGRISWLPRRKSELDLPVVGQLEHRRKGSPGFAADEPFEVVRAPRLQQLCYLGRRQGARQQLALDVDTALTFARVRRDSTFHRAAALRAS